MLKLNKKKGDYSGFGGGGSCTRLLVISAYPWGSKPSVAWTPRLKPMNFSADKQIEVVFILEVPSYFCLSQITVLRCVCIFVNRPVPRWSSVGNLSLVCACNVGKRKMCTLCSKGKLARVAIPTSYSRNPGKWNFKSETRHCSRGRNSGRE